MIAKQKHAASAPADVFGASLSRRGFVKTGGILVAGFSLIKADTAQKTGAAKFDARKARIVEPEPETR